MAVWPVPLSVSQISTARLPPRINQGGSIILTSGQHLGKTPEKK
jgi:hypothetical protein